MHLPLRACRPLRLVGHTPRHRPESASDRFTDRARDALALAQDEARRLQHDFIGTEHLLLGILRTPESLGARLLADLGVALDATRTTVEGIVGPGSAATVGERALTGRVKRSLELAVAEAAALGHDYVCTEHLLLGLAREGAGVAAGILRDRAITHERLRAEIGRGR